MNELIEALRDPRVWPHACGRIELVETHISWVLLTGKFAYKIKKPVRFHFVDFSTLEQRRCSCIQEVRLNRRLAAELYLDVVPIGGTPANPQIGTTPAIEYAVRMIQFRPSDTLDQLMDHIEIAPQAFHDLAERIAAFHDELSPVNTQKTTRALQKTLEGLVSASNEGDRKRLEIIALWEREQSENLEPDLRQRAVDGFVRECHGDLHLGNLVWLRDRITPFDCIEFSFELRCIDTLDEVAFLVMDLMAYGRPDLGFEFLNRYLEHTGDYAGVRLLRYYLVYRALVRSYVRVLAAKSANPLLSRPYLDLTERLIERQQPLLLITRGLSGSGKSTVTQALIGEFSAIRIRSDIVRKRLRGLPMDAESGSATGAGLYAPDVSDDTYQALAGFADIALEAGFNVIVDAACLERRRRSIFAELAQRRDVPLVMLNLQADEVLLRQRVTARHARGRDASEANVSVIDYQLAQEEAIARDEPGIVIDLNSDSPVDAHWLAREISTRLAPQSK